MGLIRRNITRVVKVSTEVTSATDTPSATTVAIALTTSESLYLGYKKPFTTRYFKFGTANTVANTLAVKYWNGTTWVAVEDLVDQTAGFTLDGFLNWQNPGSWTKKALSPITDVELFWIQITPGANFHASTTLQAVLNIALDDTLVRSYYPELLSDSSKWLPPSRTDYLEQYVAAWDLVALRLTQEGAIQDESQLIEINKVSLANVHAFAWILLRPLAKSQEEIERADGCFKDMNLMIEKAHFPVDVDNSGEITPSEEKASTQVRLR